MKKKKLTYLIVGLGLIIALVLIYIFGIRTGKLVPWADVDVATMGLEPSSGTYQVDQTFDVNIVVNTGNRDTDAATAVLNFDSNYLDVVDADSTRAGTQITPGTIYPNMMTNNVNGNKIVFEGSIDLIADPIVPFNGTGTFATIKFLAKQSGTTSVTFGYVEDSRDMDSSQIISHDGDTILAQPANATYTIEIPPLQPTVDIKANDSDGPVSIDSGSSVNLAWGSVNADSCTASGDWSDNIPTNGTATKDNLTSPKTYIITCTGAGPDAEDNVVVNINYPNAPTVDIKANDSDGPTINSGESITLSWTSADADSCSASGDWSDTIPTNGSATKDNLTSAQTYIIICTGAGEPARDAVTVNVQTGGGGGGGGGHNNGGTGDTGGTSDTGSTATTTPSTSTTTTKPPSTSISKLPSTTQPQTTPEKTNVTVKNSAFKTWALWFLYAIIPAFLAGAAIYLYLKRKKQNKNDQVI